VLVNVPVGVGIEGNDDDGNDDIIIIDSDFNDASWSRDFTPPGIGERPAGAFFERIPREASAAATAARTTTTLDSSSSFPVKHVVVVSRRRGCIFLLRFRQRLFATSSPS
jgi:hypothetical protein